MNNNAFQNETMRKFLEIGVALTAEKDYNKLLEKILTGARQITNADGGTLYLLENGQLHYKMMQTQSRGICVGGNGQKIDLPPVALQKSNVCAYSAITRQTIHVPDVYRAQAFDFSGQKRVDAATDYVTKSMLIVPLINREDKVIGVLQLINALDAQGTPVSFFPQVETIVQFLSSQAGIALENMRYVAENKQFFESFVEVMATTIDERTPYNANHSRNIARLIAKFAAYLNTVNMGSYRDLHFDKAQIVELVTTAWLHDIGKLAIPLEVLDKPTRLGSTLDTLLLRLELVQAKLQIRYLEQLAETDTPEHAIALRAKWQEAHTYVDSVRQFVQEINRSSTVVDTEKREKLEEIWRKHWDGIADPLLTDAEFENLSIARGTLNAHERKIIEQHVSITARILSKMTFPESLQHVPKWAAKHHEFLDGSGYYMGCTAQQLPTPVRMLTILDIYDALTAIDRPYKDGMPKEQALKILTAMAQEGKLDEELVQCFIESRVWESPV